MKLEKDYGLVELDIDGLRGKYILNMLGNNDLFYSIQTAWDDGFVPKPLADSVCESGFKDGDTVSLGFSKPDCTPLDIKVKDGVFSVDFPEILKLDSDNGALKKFSLDISGDLRLFKKNILSKIKDEESRIWMGDRAFFVKEDEKYLYSDMCIFKAHKSLSNIEKWRLNNFHFTKILNYFSHLGWIFFFDNEKILEANSKIYGIPHKLNISELHNSNGTTEKYVLRCFTKSLDLRECVAGELVRKINNASKNFKSECLEDVFRMALWRSYIPDRVSEQLKSPGYCELVPKDKSLDSKFLVAEEDKSYSIYSRPFVNLDFDDVPVKHEIVIEGSFDNAYNKLREEGYEVRDIQNMDKGMVTFRKDGCKLGIIEEKIKSGSPEIVWRAYLPVEKKVLKPTQSSVN